MDRNRLESIYLKIWNNASIHRYYLNKYLKEFSHYIKPSSLIIDVGCGEFRFTSIPSSRKYVSVDIQKTDNVDVMGDICNLPFLRDKADIIICTEVLEHVEDSDKALGELNRVLKKGGYLIISMPFLHGVHLEADFHRFTERKFKNYLEEHGFEILEFKRRGGIFSSISSLIYQVPYQIFKTEKVGLKYYVFYSFMFGVQLSFIVINKISIALDTLDKKKHFTPGYCALCVKKGNYGF